MRETGSRMEAGGSIVRSPCRHGGPRGAARLVRLRGAAAVCYHLYAAQTAVAALVGGGSLAATATAVGQKMSQALDSFRT